MHLLNLKPAMERPCKLCGGPSPVFGLVDYNRSCSMTGERAFPPAGIAIPYNRCSQCRFLFSAAFDGWTHAQFLEHIYNSGYALVDADYELVRPKASLSWLETLFGEHRDLRILDYGGGNGMLEQLARKAGFAHITTYDPFTPEYAALPREIFDIVTCFETLEHVPDPLGAIGKLCALTDKEGVILFSTLPQPPDIDRLGVDWWYVGPRNGHISLFSDTNLQTSFNRFGLKVAFFDHNKFIAFRKIPPFAQHLFERWRQGTEYDIQPS